MTIITLCGGYSSVAKITGRDLTRVRRWTYPKARGGSDGLIPSECAALLMDHARKTGLPLTPDHFFPEPSGNREEKAA